MTMQVIVDIGDTTFTTLLNSDSTHNFIDISAAVHTRISLQGGDRLRDVVANDNRLTNLGCCTNFCIGIAYEPFCHHLLQLGAWLLQHGVGGLVARVTRPDAQGFLTPDHGISPKRPPRPIVRDLHTSLTHHSRRYIVGCHGRASPLLAHLRRTNGLISGAPT
jgi:hypothetical protein